jgi:hypothetical protein
MNCITCSKIFVIKANAFCIMFMLPVTVTMRSGVELSVIEIVASDYINKI